MVFAVLAYFLFLFIYLRRKKIWGGAQYLVLVYLASVFFSAYLTLYAKNKVYFGSLWPSFLFCFLLTIYFVPYFKKSIIIKREQSSAFMKSFIFVGYSLSIFLILGELLILPKLREVFLYGLADARDAMYQGVNIFTSYSLTEHIGHSILRWLGGISYSMILMFFYAIAFVKKKYIFKTLLIISSTSGIIIGMLVGGRTSVVYWLLFFGFAATLFWPNLDSKKKSAVRWSSVLFGGVVLGYFALITFARTALASDYGNDSSFFIGYLGQPYINYCDFIENVDWHPYSFKRVFPLSHFAIGKGIDLTKYRDLIYSHTGKDIGIFYTLLGDFYVDLGYLGMFGYTFIYLLIARKLMRRKQFDFSSILLLGVMCQIPLHGLFYYSLWNPECSFSIIAVIFMSEYFKNFKNKSKSAFKVPKGIKVVQSA